MPCYVRGIFPIIYSLFFLYGFAVFGQTQNSTPPAPEFQLTVGGEVERPLKLSLADLAKLPRRTVKAKDHDRPEATFEGVPLMEILQMAGIKFGEKLRGQALTTYLLVEASDGYKVLFALAELDSAFTDQIVLLADRRDNESLSETEGPLRIIVPHEKRHGRWVRQVTSLIIRRP
jgi:DMSO/TMAO reductase YedYZ molybdopterin-dependent catalytic subunit